MPKRSGVKVKLEKFFPRREYHEPQVKLSEMEIGDKLWFESDDRGGMKLRL